MFEKYNGKKLFLCVVEALIRKIAAYIFPSNIQPNSRNIKKLLEQSFIDLNVKPKLIISDSGLQKLFF